jgi:thiamine kinase-like enzyme
MENFDDIFITIFKILSRKGISVFTETLKKHKHQGWMSSVFTVESDNGTLMIHLINPIREHQRNKLWDKFHGLSNVLSAHPKIPTSKIVCSKLIGKVFVIVQLFITGKRAGVRVLNKTVISDKWIAKKGNIVPGVLNILASIHAIHLNGFGCPVLKNGKLEGKYKTWKKYIESNYPLWIKEIEKADQRLALKDNGMRLGEAIRPVVDRINYQGPSVLVHGDSINPSNILVNERNRVSIIDWEWSISADPAWEFCDLGWWDQINIKNFLPYFEAANIKKHSERIDFIDRIETCIPLWILWGTYIHANDSEPGIYIALRILLNKKLSVMNKIS